MPYELKMVGHSLKVVRKCLMTSSYFMLWYSVHCSCVLRMRYGVAATENTIHVHMYKFISVCVCMCVCVITNGEW